jgi:hypothetical protein
LQREERDAARALGQDEIAWLHPGQCIPGGQRRAWQRRGRNGRPAARRLHHSVFAQLHLLGHNAIDRAAEHLPATPVAHRAAQPMRHDDRADEIAELGTRDAGPDRGHPAGAIAQHDQRQGAALAPIAAPRKDEIAEVDGRGVHLDEQLARARRRRYGPLADGDMLDAPAS